MLLTGRTVRKKSLESSTVGMVEKRKSEPFANDAAAKGFNSRRRWLFRLICVTLPLFLLAVGSVMILARNEWIVWDERGLRFQQPPLLLKEPGWKKTGHVYLFDPILGWRNRPSWKATTNGKPLTINSLGLRGPECNLDKHADCFRVLALGDSFGWGYGVGDEEVFSSVLQQKCSTQFEQPVEVLNASVSGWGTDQQYLYLKNEGVHFQPDLVVLLFFPVNDIENNSHSSQYGMNKPMFWSRRLRDPKPVAKPGGLKSTKRYTGNPVKLTIAIVEAMADECNAIDSELLVLKFGEYLFPGNEAMRESSQMLAESIDSIGEDVTFIDLDEMYQAQSISSARLISGNDDGHWNAFGHQFTADVIFDFLEQRVALK